ncbi:L-histidine N(alpha)-methyltransferase [Gloeocapsopsis crepidinum LEGE 06123]|uniref:L-histidine N(Alpha)-methyltransferase n=1 Tax=Gloeocapsopsis crepidinum LEGE 06123 TaxID=588587 RepID=A0ABR9UZC6_9CHRO|nr:L-histidine N(alpha)-methyltransferase [Gloeocapsopsis crepidinum]MBE9193667.1 L-histidine N(alpha)-methyltransferase [Gloeocapsopsis crepidinum LEGE 06123]
MRIPQQDTRLRWIDLTSSETTGDDGADAIQGLSQTPKTLPCRYLYDDRGSELFEQICDLPEYYPTRTEQGILTAYVQEVAQLTGTCELVELGSGSSRKTRLLIEAYSQGHQLQYYPIDVSTGILKTTAQALLHQYPKLKLCGLAGTYEQALAQLPPRQLDNRMLIFLGSTLGNLDRQACDRFLAQVKQALKPGEFFLVGVDLQKPIEIIEAAYNDTQGVTAAFNLNILRHLNHRFQGNFQLDQFAHQAFYNPVDCQIEMHLRSLQDQTVVLQTLDYQVSFQAGETIRTEISRKFHLPDLIAVLENHTLKPLQVWTDPQAWFALLLCQRQCTDSECP